MSVEADESFSNTLAMVVQNTHDLVIDDEDQTTVLLSPFVTKMVEDGVTRRKAG
ncbi:hypothetical protein [Desulforhopalus singaporensis]|uniref:Uncharacterized protein n=1 Tax=Desulforhopalus singaporensis TaxID=91360 RepID=A0A1H0V1L0_9BACT|nr:hypothetical protein [Desulforhopalus singaporensis]SDP71926.1 hypothetical protein SAMN05660330_03811 [Desulforhopalus singaporensis]